MAAGPEKLAGMITKLGGGAEHSCGAAWASPASVVVIDQGGKLAARGQLLQGVGKERQPLWGSAAVEQYVEGGLFHHCGENADPLPQPVLAQIGFKPRGAVVDEAPPLHQQLVVVGLAADPAAVDDEAADGLEPSDSAAAVIDEDDPLLTECPDVLPAVDLDRIVAAYRQVIAHREDGGLQVDELAAPLRAVPHAADEIQLAVPHLLLQALEGQGGLIPRDAQGRLPRLHPPEQIDADPPCLPSCQGQVLGGRIGLRRRVVNLGGSDGPTGWGKQAKQQSHPDDHLIQGLDRGDAHPSSAGSGTQGTRH